MQTNDRLRPPSPEGSSTYVSPSICSIIDDDGLGGGGAGEAGTIGEDETKIVEGELLNSTVDGEAGRTDSSELLLAKTSLASFVDCTP